MQNNIKENLVIDVTNICYNIYNKNSLISMHKIIDYLQ